PLSIVEGSGMAFRLALEAPARFRAVAARHRSLLPHSTQTPDCSYYDRGLGLAFPPEVLRATAARMSALNAPASTSSPSWMSIARLVFPSRLELKSLAGSANEAPLAKVNFTIDL